ncbi:hypothetical protein BD324DRAFT_648625 [Kockovaella imperatae]|uniref:Ribosome biogenesis protein NSA1 n=1 Tax=Kockovaella imperatae TaxID=4999 RepID=A0A1Y1UPQ7_9TREE|nr:hypothetical protein BD324DRAFT_648625 [Kockovaella imperatae]ORX40011.1 hypothetical protein BD324DRAFT_648625 [Kockovaella imperatae]
MSHVYSFIAPSSAPATLFDVSISSDPSASSSSSSSSLTSIAVNHASHAPIGSVKRICKTSDGSIVLADDAYRLSVLSARPEEVDWEPEVITQHEVSHRKGDLWSGLIPVSSGFISSLSSGKITYNGLDSALAGESSNSHIVDGHVLALASPRPSSNTFALAGKEIDVSIRDVERTFASSSRSQNGEGGSSKKRKTELVEGEIWRAKNMPNNSLQLRPPVHHLCLAYLPLPSGSESGDSTHLVSGTKAGTLRRYDTRQRKPVSEHKLAREGGIGAIAPVNEHEVFFADRGNFVGCADLRTGKLMYSYPGLTSSAHHLVYLNGSPVHPTSDDNSYDEVGHTLREGLLASISPDATLRLLSTVPPREPASKGNPQGGKAKVVGVAGGVGLGSFIYTGFKYRPVVQEEGNEESERAGGSEEGDEDVWNDMDTADSDEDEDEEG